MQQLETLDVDLACRHFAAAFRNPAEFTLCFTGAFEVSHGPLSLLSTQAAHCWGLYGTVTASHNL